MKSLKIFLTAVLAIWIGSNELQAQCTSADIMEPGFNFITSSRGCAPFTIEIQTLYLNSTPGTIYHVDWGDGSPVQDYTQINSYPNGPIISHAYIDAPVDCGYQVIVEVENPCNPLGQVVLEPINVIVWTEDIITADPDVYRVCEGFASNINFSDNSNWNCFPRADARENADPRWIQWIYGRGTNAGRISNVQVDGIAPGAYPYYDPAFGTDPKYPVTDVVETSLNVMVPPTATVGQDFYITLNNWNTCNAYDENVSDGNPLNPVIPGGDNPPRTSESRIVIVESPTPDFQSRKENMSNPPSSDFCIDDIIYFENLSGGPAGSGLIYTWEFYDGPNVADGLLQTKTDNNPVFSYSTGGVKLVRLVVGDNNAVGSCSAVVEKTVRISPTAIAQIGTANTSFCKTRGSAESFDVTFTDETVGSIAGTDEWRWELYDENDILIKAIPSAANTYIDGPKQSVTQTYSNPGVYKTRLIYRDKVTQCDTRDEINIVIYNNPEPAFSAASVCDGLSSELINESTLDIINGNKIVKWEWDFDYDNITFDSDSVFDLSQPDTIVKKFNYDVHQIALRATNDQNGCSAIFTAPVEVYQNPTASFIKDSIEGCSPLVVTFDNTAASTQAVGMQEYIWCVDYGSGYIDTLRSDPNDASFSSAMTTTFENWSTSSKTFKIILKAISEDGCAVNSGADSVKVLPSIKPGFYYTNYEPLAKNCAPVEVNFQVDDFTMSLLPSTYTWTIRDEEGVIRSAKNNATNAQFHHSFEANTQGINSYSINLKADISDICVGDSTILVNVNPVPISEFTIDTLEFGCEKMVLEIDAEQKGLLAYNWTINKGGMIFMNNSYGDNFIYEVARPGPASPNLDVSFDLLTSNYAFCESEVSTESLIVPSEPQLLASFMADPEIQVYPNATITINNTSSRTNAVHSWDFGDGSTNSEEYPNPYTYDRPGNYTIKLKLEEANCESEDSVNIFIQPTAPIADFSFDPGKGCAPLTVNFTNLTQYGDPEAYIWTFGEGEGISTSENPIHTYYEPGIYSVMLEATNESGVTDAAVKRLIIEVFPVPHADFTIRPETVKLPEDPIFTTNLSFMADSYSWDFGDGGTSQEFEPSHVYYDTGHYDITLIAATEKGCMDTVTYENIVEVIDGNEISIPNAFTPSLDGPTGGSRYNGGRNDVFYPVTEGVIAYQMQIYNRWGEMLFSTTDTSKGWDGYYNGRLCAPDVYIYKIDFKFIDGREEMKFGDVALIR